MTDLTWIGETYVSDGKGGKTLVRKGSQVDIPPLSFFLEKYQKDGGRAEMLAEGNLNDLRRFLGEGPFLVTNIGLWGCGRVMLYVETKTTSGAGVYASDVVCMEEQVAEVVADQETKKLCVDCRKEEVFQGQERFDRCYSCAMNYRDKMTEWYVSTLITPEQLVNFGEYKAAQGEFTSMIILD